MLIAHKIALDLNNVQATHMACAAGTARFTYNWALARSGGASTRRANSMRRGPSRPRCPCAAS